MQANCSLQMFRPWLVYNVPAKCFTFAATAFFWWRTLPFTTHTINHLHKMPLNKKTCPHCGIEVSVGWGYQSHVKTHHAMDTATVDDEDKHDSDGCVSDEDEDFHDEDEDFHDASLHEAADVFDGLPNEFAVEDAAVSVMKYLDTLSAEGRLCPSHVMQYMQWGKRRKAQEGTMKTLLFLRAMYGGTGASRRQGQEMLNFVHGMGVAPVGMPRQIHDCWSMVNKVTLCETLNINVHPKCCRCTSGMYIWNIIQECTSEMYI